MYSASHKEIKLDICDSGVSSIMITELIYTNVFVGGVFTQALNLNTWITAQIGQVNCAETLLNKSTGLFGCYVPTLDVYFIKNAKKYTLLIYFFLRICF